MIMNEPNSQFKFPRFRCRMSLNQMEFLRGSRKRVKVLKWSKKLCNWWKLFIEFVDVKTCVSAENRPKQKRSFHNEKVRTARMDLMFLILFPILFFIFNIVYWVGFLYVVPETETEGKVEHIKIVWCLCWAAHCTKLNTHIFASVKLQNFGAVQAAAPMNFNTQSAALHCDF